MMRVHFIFLLLFIILHASVIAVSVVQTLYKMVMFIILFVIYSDWIGSRTGACH